MLGIGTGPGHAAVYGGIWTPRALGSSLELWLRADMGVTLNGSTVSAWADQSGNGRNATQGTAANQPTYVTGDPLLGNQASLDFDGTNDTIATAAFGSAVAQPCTWMVVAASDNIAAAQRHAVDGVGANRHVLYQSATGACEAFISATITSGATAWLNRSRIMIMEANGASAAMYVDGHTTPKGTGNTGAVTVTGVRISSFNGSAQFWSGTIAEVVLVSGCSTSIRQNLATYAARRYGITLS